MNDSAGSSSNPNYSPGRERKLEKFSIHVLASACITGDSAPDSDSVATAKFLEEINKEHGFNIAIDMEDIKKKLARMDNKVKKEMKILKKASKRKRKSSSFPIPEENQEVVADDQAAVVGGEILIMRRKLSRTDMDDHQGRLSMPMNQVKTHDFLTKSEFKYLNQKINNCVPAQLIDTVGGTYDVPFKSTKSGNSNNCYTIWKPWNEIKKKNGFGTGMEIDIWSFRGDNGQLCIRLEKA